MSQLPVTEPQSRRVENARRVWVVRAGSHEIVTYTPTPGMLT